MRTCSIHTIDCAYKGDALSLYNTLMPRNNTLLLEGAEIASKNNTKSLLITHSCLRIEATGATTVTATALNTNGQAILHTLQHKIGEMGEFIADIQEGHLDFLFPQVDTTQPEHMRIKSPNVLSILRVIKDTYDDIFMGGVFGFDLIACAEDLPPVPNGQNDCPNYVIYVAENMMLVDHINQKTTVKGFVFDSTQTNRIQTQMDMLTLLKPTDFKTYTYTADMPTTVHLTSSINDTDYCTIVKKCQEYIKAGDVFQVVPSRNFSLPCPNPLSTYGHLKILNPSPYMFYMNDENFAIFGASPESALKYETDTNTVSLYPIAGTRPRGKHADGTINTDLDTRYELDMLLDTKETSEHIMLLDLARNDIARISIPHTRTVSKLLQIDKYSHVQHLVSLVQGKLRPEYDCLHAYQACMNMGTLTGAPKVRATEIIREMEISGRGSYGGAVGYINGAGDMDTCITIRSAFVKDGTAHIGAGAGIVLQSVPQSEANETYIKAMSVITAIKNAHNYILGEGNV